MNSSPTIEQLVRSRLNDLFLDVKIAQQKRGEESQPAVNVIELAQSGTARSLLRVEKQAIREKDLNSKHDLNFLANMTEQINTEVVTRLVESLQDTDNLYDKIIGLDATMPHLLDAIGVKVATISKIEPLASDMPWFFNDLMKMVNQPKYRRVDAKGNVVLVDNLRVGLSFFGIENLITVVVSLAFKRWLPQITDPYPQIKLRLLEEGLATAISCKKIAGISGVNPNHAFCLGMLQLMGKIVVSKLYFRIFDNVQREALIETQKNQQHDEHSALTRVHACGEFLNELIDQHALEVSSRLINKMGMKRVMIASAMQELEQRLPLTSMSPLAKVVTQGQSYAHYRMLKGHKLIDIQQSKDFIRGLKMPKGSLELLKITDMRSLNLQIDQQ
jgi:hypothetical protein